MKNIITNYKENNYIQDFINNYYNFIIDNEITTGEALQLATDLQGYSEETLNDVLYIKCGYRDLEQLYDCEVENFDWSLFE